MYTPDLFLEADFSACFAVLSTSSILSGNRFLVICWSVKLKVMTTLSLYIAGRIGIEDKKLLLFDDFVCWDEGCYMGEVSKEVIAQMRKSN